MNPPKETGTGRLKVTVTDDAHRPLPHATVWIYRNRNESKFTGPDGSVSFEQLPGSVIVYADHDVGSGWRTAAVAQQGETTIDLIVKPTLPQPTVALLPVEVVPGSVSADRRELALRVALVASRKAPLILAGPPSERRAPYLGLSFDAAHSDSSRDCNVYISAAHPAPECSTWGTPPFLVSVAAFGYDDAGTVAIARDYGSVSSTLLLLDQGARVSAFDATAARGLSAMHFVDRHLENPANLLAIAGFAGGDGVIPNSPLWLPRGAGTPFTHDRIALLSDLDVVLPLTGGISPVIPALESAMATLGMAGGSSETPRQLVAIVGGGDYSELGEGARAPALESLRLNRTTTGVQAIFIGALQGADATARSRLAELAEALQAPLVAPGRLYYEPALTTTGQELYAALDLSADLLAGNRLQTLTATFRVRAPDAGRFAAGATLHGELYVQHEYCPWICAEAVLPFAARIP